LGDDLSNHTLIGSDRDPSFHKLLREIGMKPSDFCFRTDSLLLQAEAIFSGLGIGALHEIAAKAHPDLVRVVPDFPPMAYPIWVVTHESLRRHQSIWTLFRSLGNFLERQLMGCESISPKAL
jgi:DNA-binding transcriptional LysR family regulator